MPNATEATIEFIDSTVARLRRLRLAVEQGRVHRAGRAVQQVGHAVGGDEGGRPRDEAHDDGAEAVEDARDDRGAGHADAPARPPAEGRADGEDRPARRRHRAHDGAGALLAADELGEPDRLEGLEDDHRDRPEELDGDDAAQHRVVAQQAEALTDDTRGLLGRARGPVVPPRLSRCSAERGSAQQHEDGEQVHDVEGHEDGDRQHERRRAGERVPPDEATRDQRTGRDADTDARSPAAESAPSTSASGRRSRGPCRRTMPRADRSRAPGRSR